MSGSFKMLCEQLSQKLVPALAASGYSGPTRFHRREIRYDFKRQSIDGTHVVSILFDKYRNPDFSVQLYLEPPEGLGALIARGGQLIVGDVVPTRRVWPLGLPLFRAERPKWQRLFGKTASAEEAVGRCIALMPEIEGWWVHQRPSRHILSGRVVYRGPAVSA